MPKNDVQLVINLRNRVIGTTGNNAANTSGTAAGGVLWANTVRSNPTGLVTAGNVQAAINQLEAGKLSRQGSSLLNGHLLLFQNATLPLHAAPLQQVRAEIVAEMTDGGGTLLVQNRSGIVQAVIRPDFFRLGPPAGPALEYNEDETVAIKLDDLAIYPHLQGEWVWTYPGAAPASWTYRLPIYCVTRPVKLIHIYVQAVGAPTGRDAEIYIETRTSPEAAGSTAATITVLENTYAGNTAVDVDIDSGTFVTMSCANSTNITDLTVQAIWEIR